MIAAEANIAEGTLFGYVGSKAELFHMVVNDYAEDILADRLETPVDEMASTSTVGRLVRVLEPIIEAAVLEPGNFAIYQREIIFGDDGPNRREGLRVLAAIETKLGEILAADPDLRLRPALTPREAGRLLWSSMLLELLGMSMGNPCERDRREALRTHVDAVVGGLLVAR